MIRSLTIISDDGKHRAFVTPTENGAEASYFRAYCDNAGKFAGWRFLRRAEIPQPFHVALDLATDLVNAA